MIASMNPIALLRKLLARMNATRRVRDLLSEATRNGAYDPDRDSFVPLIPGTQVFRVHVTYNCPGVAGIRHINIRCDRRTSSAAMVAYAIRVVSATLPPDARLGVSGSPVEVKA